MAAVDHSHEGLSHSHGGVGDHGHSHEILDGPGSFIGREMPIIEGRNWDERAFTVGIGGYVYGLVPSVITSSFNVFSFGQTELTLKMAITYCPFITRISN